MARTKITNTDQLRDFIRKKTNWKKLIKTLEEQAVGGFEFLNYNGQKTIAEPNLEALKLLLFYVYGKYPDATPIKEKDTNSELLKRFLNQMHKSESEAKLILDKQETNSHSTED